MTSSIGFYCGPSDNEALQEYAKSIGLFMVAPIVGKIVSLDPSQGPFCFLSLASVDKLHPYGKPAIRVGPVKDPMLFFMRSYFSNPYLVAGHIQWSDDNAILAAQIKPFYQDLCKWIKKNWKPLEGIFYLGLEAEFLVEKGAQKVNAIPGEVKFETIKV